jgi:hypothetical protein
MNHKSTPIDIEAVAYLAIVGLCLVLMGAILTAGPVTIEQRGTVLGGVVVTLFTVAWRARHRGYIGPPREPDIGGDDGTDT